MTRHRFVTLIVLLTASRVGTAQAGSPVAVAPAPEYATGRQPQVAVGPSGSIHVTFGAGNTIFCATSDDCGRSFAPPAKVAEQGVLALGKRRGPRVAATSTSVCVAAICGEHGHGKDGDLLVWRSTNRGKNWTAPVAVNRVAGAAREGLHDLAPAADGRLFCVWIDLRAGRSQIFGALSSDGGTTWGEDRLVYESPAGGVCPCCQPSACFDQQGRIHVLWRNNLSDDRDMYLATSADGGRTWDAARKLGVGTWHLKACPMDGGGLAADRDSVVTTIWRRNQTAFRCIDGKPEMSLGPGEQGRAARGPDGVYLTWITQRAGALFVLPPSGARPLRLADAAVDPAIAARSDGHAPVVVAWEETNAPGGPIRLQVITP